MKPPERELMKVIVNYPNYKITSLGRVYNITRKKFLRPLDIHGYLSVKLYRHGQFKTPMISTLVLEAFVGPRPISYTVRHLNGDNADNRLVNLEWVQRKTQLTPITETDRAGAFDAFKIYEHKKGGLSKHWPLKEIVRVFPSVKNTKQAKQLLLDYREHVRSCEETED